MLAVALPLAALDLWVKASEPTQAWAYHPRSFGWLLLSVSLVAGMVIVTRIPSLLVAPAAGVLAGGLLGNSLSAASSIERCPIVGQKIDMRAGRSGTMLICR